MIFFLKNNFTKIQLTNVEFLAAIHSKNKQLDSANYYLQKVIDLNSETKKLLRCSDDKVVDIIFNSLNDKSVVTMIFKVASYTYGPLLGLYAFGLFMKSKTVHDKLVPIVCIISPLICFLLAKNSASLFGDYVIDNELIIVNGIITFIGLLIISKPATSQTKF